jgi:tRNA(Ile)-lysidine synthase
MLTEFAGKRICVAVSGGVDSISLLHWLKGREAEYGYTLCAVHCEHGIRGEDSLRDARFVREFCDKLGVQLHSFSEDCPMRAERDKQSLETAARAFRIECFQRLLTEGKADVIATAHHKNDDAETVLFRLLRGTSLTGVGGISANNGQIIRPFLSWTRADIEAYAKENGLDFCIDCTNFETDATRNKLRLQALPLLEDCVAGAMENLTRFAKLASEDDELLYRLSQALVTVENEGVLVSFSKEKPLFKQIKETYYY